METNPTSAEELKTIRKIMEESTKFLSLSGLSGVFPGIFAIAGALAAWLLIFRKNGISTDQYFNTAASTVMSFISWKMLIVALTVLSLSLATAFYFSVRKAKRTGVNFWTPVSRRMMINLFIPLVAGGIFALILIFHGHTGVIIPVLLIFYGLSLVNAGKFTYNEIFYLGILQIVTGLLCALFPAQGLLFWSLGFGVLHIVYGLFMYRKYEA
ncbi:MAG TPA: hypothetical protein PLV06_05225 [Bacteroidales bacterium]|nr:hypothetical protein [Bacteroidales bacterium]HPJ60863.1 hypothetical protein [Bacteroidales bacterium]HPR11765.1 hypothetical protein [Bacteroidales bacterium]HRW84087.1 hypothetical protein [Bacteroidales bacterium]